MAKFSTTSNLNNLDLTAVCYGMNDIFLNEYYSSVYLTVKNAARQLSFSDGYEYFIEKAMKEKLNLKNRKKKVRVSLMMPRSSWMKLR